MPIVGATFKPLSLNYIIPICHWMEKVCDTTIQLRPILRFMLQDHHLTLNLGMIEYLSYAYTKINASLFRFTTQLERRPCKDEDLIKWLHWLYDFTKHAWY
jgi:hypothetical protein